MDGGAGRDVAIINARYADVTFQKVVKGIGPAPYKAILRATDEGVDEATSIAIVFADGSRERYDRVEDFRFADIPVPIETIIADKLRILPSGTGTAATSTSTVPSSPVTPDTATSVAGDVSASVSTTARMFVGQTYINAVEVANDKDWVGVDLVGGVKYHLSIGGQSFGSYAPIADSFFRLRGATGTEVSPSGGILDRTNGYEADYVAPSTGTYYVSIGAGGSAYQSLTGGYALTLTAMTSASPANHNPTAGNDTFDAFSRQNIDGYLLTNDRDDDGDRVYAAVVSNATTARGGTFQIASDGHFSYSAPAISSATTDSFTYTVLDGRGGTAVGTVNISLALAPPGPLYFTQYDDNFDVTSNQAVYALSGNDLITVKTSTTAYGGDGNDRFVAFASQGASGAFLVGGPGDDWFITDGSVTVDGDNFNSQAEIGFDTLDLSRATAALTMDIQQPYFGIISGRQLLFRSINQMIATDYGDTIYNDTNPSVGFVKDDIIRAGNGNDYVEIGGGKDTVYGGQGNDSIRGGPGAEYLYGDEGDDNIEDLGGGNDQLLGGIGNDGLFGGDGNDTLDGGPGDDIIWGESQYGSTPLPGDDYYWASEGNDEITDRGGRDVINFSRFQASVAGNFSPTGDGPATLSSGSNNTRMYGQFETLIATSFGDIISISNPSGGRLIDLGAGNDRLFSFTQVAGDTLIGGDGDDIISGCGTMSGGGGNDNLSGKSLDDRLFGEDGDDGLSGGGGADLLNGGAGNDTIVGGAGADTLAGDVGIDILSYAGSTAVSVNLTTGAVSGGDAVGDVITDFEGVIGSDGNDTLIGTATANFLDGGAGTDNIDGGAGDDILAGGLGADTLMGGAGTDLVSYASSSSAITIILATNTVFGGDATGDIVFNVEGAIGSAFNDIMLGDGNANIFTGGAGSDEIAGGAGSDTLAGGDGTDFINGGAGADSIDGGLGLDVLRYDGSPAGIVVRLDYGVGLNGDAAGDSIAGVETVVASAFQDFLIGDADTNGLFGQGGDDWLYGQGGSDALIGGAGSDQLLGGAGSDQMYGGAGNDQFWFLTADMAVGVWDYIYDFGQGDANGFDYLRFEGFPAGSIRTQDLGGAMLVSTAALSFNGGFIVYGATPINANTFTSQLVFA